MSEVLILMACIMPSIAFGAQLSGTAKNSKGEVVYLERHYIEQDASGLSKFIKVDYAKQDGSVFATMTSDFSKNKFVPETVFEDKRFSSKTTMKIVGNNVEFQEFKNDVSILKKAIPLKDSMVASQGFDNFIRANLVNLEKKSLDFNFGVMGKRDFYSLTGYKRSSPNDNYLEFGIKASSWIVGLFTGELRVIYEKNKKRLKSFMGTSNILNDKGESQEVSISYDWVAADE